MRPLWTASCTACGERKNLSAKAPPGAEVCIFLYGISSVNAVSNRWARGVIGVQRIDERQHIADRALALGRSAPRLLLMPALCALSGRLFLFRRILRKGGTGRFRVMYPKCVVARYVAEILRQAPEADVLVVIAANGGRCVRSAKLCVLWYSMVVPLGPTVTRHRLIGLMIERYRSFKRKDIPFSRQ